MFNKSTFFRFYLWPSGILNFFPIKYRKKQSSSAICIVFGGGEWQQQQQQQITELVPDYIYFIYCLNFIILNQMQAKVLAIIRCPVSICFKPPTLHKRTPPHFFSVNFENFSRTAFSKVPVVDCFFSRILLFHV